MKDKSADHNLPRRKFIRQTALAGAGIAFTPAIISTANTNSTHSENQMTMNIKSKGYAAFDTSGKLKPWEFER